MECLGGELVDSCVAGDPVAEICDGLDNDCDGVEDNGIASVPTTCGEGECASAGALECLGGELIDSCVAGDPVAEICDGLDNDCDGVEDNGIASVPTTCGEGECASAGALECVGGELIDSCVAGDPVAEICDGVDNDCDGVEDNGIASVPTTCGEGECAGVGALECLGGELVDSCVAGDPSWRSATVWTTTVTELRTTGLLRCRRPAARANVPGPVRWNVSAAS